MGQRIDDENELVTLREKAHKWDLLVKFLDQLPQFQEWLKKQEKA